MKIEWAQIDELAGNPFTIQAGAGRITGKFASTHGWANYESRVVGQLTLPIGTTRVILRPNGPVKTELADVRSISLVPVANKQ